MSIGKIGDCVLGGIGCAVASVTPDSLGQAILLWGSVALVVGRCVQLFIVEMLFGITWPPRPRWWRRRNG
jgi:uncharacterized membrane protein YeaQ/YmgE (transglycosylase-associated protein family)